LDRLDDPKQDGNTSGPVDQLKHWTTGCQKPHQFLDVCLFDVIVLILLDLLVWMFQEKNMHHPSTTHFPSDGRKQCTGHLAVGFSFAEGGMKQMLNEIKEEVKEIKESQKLGAQNFCLFTFEHRG